VDTPPPGLDGAAILVTGSASMTRHLPEQARREQILRAARRCFIDNGYHPTRMDDIAREAELSKGGVYFHFKSKQEVFAQLVEEEFARSMRFLQNVEQGEGTIFDKMQLIAGHYLEYFNAAPDAPRFFIVMGEMALRDEQLSQRLLEMQTAFIDEIAQLLERGVREGMLREVDTTAVAAILKALLDGLEGLHALSYPMEVSRFLGTGLQLVLRGLAPAVGSETPSVAPGAEP
jgi:AcrR family transcriptional regulator